MLRLEVKFDFMGFLLWYRFGFINGIFVDCFWCVKLEFENGFCIIIGVLDGAKFFVYGVLKIGFCFRKGGFGVVIWLVYLILKIGFCFIKVEFENGFFVSEGCFFFKEFWIVNGCCIKLLFVKEFCSEVFDSEKFCFILDIVLFDFMYDNILNFFNCFLVIFVYLFLVFLLSGFGWVRYLILNSGKLLFLIMFFIRVFI